MVVIAVIVNDGGCGDATTNLLPIFQGLNQVVIKINGNLSHKILFSYKPL